MQYLSLALSVQGLFCFILAFREGYVEEYIL